MKEKPPVKVILSDSVYLPFGTITHTIFKDNERHHRVYSFQQKNHVNGHVSPDDQLRINAHQLEHATRVAREEAVELQLPPHHTTQSFVRQEAGTLTKRIIEGSFSKYPKTHKLYPLIEHEALSLLHDKTSTHFLGSEHTVFHRKAARGGQSS